MLGWDSPQHVSSRGWWLPGYKLLYSFRTQKGLTYKGVDYGFIQGAFYYYAVYEAPSRHYFKKDYETFERVRESLRLVQEGKS